MGVRKVAAILVFDINVDVFIPEKLNLRIKMFDEIAVGILDLISKLKDVIILLLYEHLLLLPMLIRSTSSFEYILKCIISIWLDWLNSAYHFVKSMILGWLLLFTTFFWNLYLIFCRKLDVILKIEINAFVYQTLFIVVRWIEFRFTLPLR